MLNILYEDNHLLILNKRCGELVQGDITGDLTLADKARQYIKEKYNKPGNVFLGIPHRLDRPTSGIVVYTKTSKALQRMTALFKDKKLTKTYRAICMGNIPQNKMHLTDFLVKNKKQNKSYISNASNKEAKKAELILTVKSRFKNYVLVEIELLTGRHHQIRVQLQNIGLNIKGDVKYGYPTPNHDAGISLHAYNIKFIHPIKKTELNITAPPPNDILWKNFQTKNPKNKHRKY